MIPHPLPLLVLALAGYRLMRLAGWDTFPLAVKTRDWLTGAQEFRSGTTNAMLGQTADQPEIEIRHKRPALAHFIACPFCLGFWLNLAVYLAWIFEPRWTLYAAAPLALSAFTGLVSRNLDP